MSREAQKRVAANDHDPADAPADAGSGREFALPSGYRDYYGLAGPVQRRARGPSGSEGDVQAAADRGTSGGGGPLPWADQIQRSFGRHDVSHVQAHQGTAASQASAALGAEAFTRGSHVAFAGAPTLHTAAHEAAHVVQQQAGVHLKGGIDEPGDAYETHADEVADRVVRGESAEALLDGMAGAAPSGPRTGGPVQRIVKLRDTDEAYDESGVFPLKQYIWGLLTKELNLTQAVLDDGKVEQYCRDWIFDAKRTLILNKLKSGSPERAALVEDLRKTFGEGKKGGPELPNDEKALGEHAARQLTIVQYGFVQYAHNARENAEFNWDDKFNAGTTGEDKQNLGESPYWVNPHQFGRHMHWELKPKQSASKAIRAWLTGPTIAECYTSLIAIETDALRAALGNNKFDELFGSEDPTVDQAVRDTGRQLVISINVKPPSVTEFLKRTAFSAAHGKDDPSKLDDKAFEKLVKGEWYYFKNHPSYLHKHPGGNWQGENALFLGTDQKGERLWAGLGAQQMTEKAMLQTIVDTYNDDRDAADYQRMMKKGILVEDAAGLAVIEGKKYRYTNKEYDPSQSPVLTQKITVEELLKDGGGLRLGSGQALDTEKIKAALA